MTWLYAVQFAVPPIPFGWLARVPARSGLGLVVQVFGSIAALAVMALLGIWLLPPWWMPFVVAAALGGAAWLGWRRIRPFSSVAPLTWGAWIVMVNFIALGLTSAFGTFRALRSRINTAAGVVNLAFALDRRRYLVLNGGSNISTNAHLETLDRWATQAIAASRTRASTHKAQVRSKHRRVVTQDPSSCPCPCPCPGRDLRTRVE